MIDIYTQVTLHDKLFELLKNRLVTSIAFIFLITSVFFIELHPASVWYYFSAGFFCCRMIELAFEKSALKFTIDNLIKKLRSL